MTKKIEKASEKKSLVKPDNGGEKASSKKFDKASGKTSPKMTKGLATAVKVISKIGEVAHWIGAVGMAVLSIMAFTRSNSEMMNGIAATNLTELTSYGMSVELVQDGALSYEAFGCLALGGMFFMGLMAMVFRNLYLITKNTEENDTPFTLDNMRMVKELGIFFIAIPVIGLILTTIIRLATGVECSVNLGTAIMGLVMLYLTQIFARGVKLEDDVEGLV